MKTQDKQSDPPRKVLHVGCGAKRDDKLPQAYIGPSWQEIRLDINPAVKPDIVGDIRDLHMVKDCSFDVVYSSHNLEHLYFHEVQVTLREFHRVLKVGGEVLVACPDLQQVAKLIVEDKLMDPVFTPPSGPIAPIDMLYGYRPGLAKGNHFMAHKTGFTATSLKRELERADFENIRVIHQPEPLMDIVAHAFKLK